MSKKKNAELSRMWGFAGKRHWLTIASCILAGISTVLSIIPFVCIWFVIRDILYAMKKGDLSLAASSGHYAWFAVAFSLLSILFIFSSAVMYPDIKSALSPPIIFFKKNTLIASGIKQQIPSLQSKTNNKLMTATGITTAPVRSDN